VSIIDRADFDTLTRLESSVKASEAADLRHDAYYEGSQRLEHLGLAVPPELRRFETVVNWPRLTVDSLEERLDIESFFLPGDTGTALDVWEGWEFNNLDEESQLAHVDTFIFGRSYICVGSNEDDRDHPLTTVESPREMVATRDPRTGKITEAARFFGGDPNLAPIENERNATLYLPDSTHWYEMGTGGWVEIDRDEHKLGEVPVIPLLNRRRTGRSLGVSEMTDVIPLTDAACRTLTNLQIAGETHAVPQRGVLGATKGDFVDADGNPLTTWQAYFGAVWALQNENAKTFQFSASDLRNFHDTVNHYATLVAGVTGLPMRYLGQNTANPPSADGIRADEARLVKRAERKQKTLEGSWERWARLYARFRDGDWDPRYRLIKTKWRDPATPTKQALGDYVLKLVQAGVLPIEAAWDELGYSEQKKTILRKLRDADMKTLLGLEGVKPEPDES
jgi:hypothetical protein